MLKIDVANYIETHLTAHPLAKDPKLQPLHAFVAQLKETASKDPKWTDQDFKALVARFLPIVDPSTEDLVMALNHIKGVKQAINMEFPGEAHDFLQGWEVRWFLPLSGQT